MAGFGTTALNEGGHPVRTSSLLLTRIAVFLALIAGSSDLALAASKLQSPVYYLALGDSLSVGAQPAGPTGQTQPTNQGCYADDLY